MAIKIIASPKRTKCPKCGQMIGLDADGCFENHNDEKAIKVSCFIFTSHCDESGKAAPKEKIKAR